MSCAGMLKWGDKLLESLLMQRSYAGGDRMLGENNRRLWRTFEGDS
jgi:hypothetical protein